MATVESLTDEEFDNGRTLCAGWAPRDVLAHIVGCDRMSAYVRPSGVTIDRANAAMVRRGRGLDRAALTELGHRVAARPSASARAFAWLLTGDVAMHHQDVLRGLGKPHELPDESAPAILREGTVWSWVFGAKLLRYRVIPTTPGCTPRGLGTPVTGTAEALALWLAGRPGIEPELRFG
jgi:uncharacterized protein (TIGR03083 family)